MRKKFIMKAKDGKSVNTSKTLQKFAGNNVMKDLGRLKGAISEKELSYLQNLNEEEGMKSLADMKDLGRLKGAVSEKELKYLQDLSSKSKGGVTKAKDGKSVKTEKVILKSGTGINSLLKLKEILTPSKKSRGGATKAKYGKMMKASHGSMVSTEGSTKSRGNGIALRATKFKGVF